MICPQCHQEIDESRTTAQNNYWWKCMTIIGDELGYRPYEISTLLKDEFGWFDLVVNKKTGAGLKAYESSANWSKKQFSINTEILIQWANEHGIRVETPEEFYNK
jgi:hypothetical protein